MERTWTNVASGRMHGLHWARVGGASRLPPIVLVHGLGMSSRYMVRAGELLSAHAEVWAPDLPGFGLSDRPARALDVPQLATALSTWCDANAIGRATFVGHSLGCQVALELLTRQPGRGHALVLAAPTVDPAGRSPLRQIGRLLADVPREPLSLGPLVASEYLRAGLPRVVRTLAFMMRDPIRRKLPTIDLAALVLQGERDGVVPIAWSREVARLLRAKHAVIGGGAHGFNYSRPIAFAAAVLEFVRSV